MGREIEAVLFDLDGVIVDSYQAWFHQFQHALIHFGHDAVSEQEFRKHWGQSTDHDVRIFMPERTVDEVKGYFFDHYSEYVKYLNIEADADRSLLLVKELGLKDGCVTNSHRPIVEKTLAHLGLSCHFDAVVTADDVILPKPAPEMLLKACVGLGVNPEHTVFLGDTPTDELAAQNAGCIFIGYGIDTEHQISNHREFVTCLERLLDRRAQQ